MRKRFLIILIACVAVGVTAIFIFTSLPSGKNPLENIFNPSPDQENDGTRNSWKFPNITFPWSSGKSSGGSGSGGSGSGGSGSGSGSENVNPPIIKNNYTLFVNTNSLEVLVTYTGINLFNETKTDPFSLLITENTSVCLSETTGSNTIKWRMENGSYCIYSDCSINDYGCNFLMDRNYSFIVIQNT